MEIELAELQAKVIDARKQVRTDALEGIKAMLDSGTLTVQDLISLIPKDNYNPVKPRAQVKGTKPPKYRDPVTGATWSGMGHEPFWIKGKSREAFLIPPNELYKIA
jgi:DNA-binding protein H-NS